MVDNMRMTNMNLRMGLLKMVALQVFDVINEMNVMMYNVILKIKLSLYIEHIFLQNTIGSIQFFVNSVYSTDLSCRIN